MENRCAIMKEMYDVCRAEKVYLVAEDAAVKFLRGEIMYDKTMTFTAVSYTHL